MAAIATLDDLDVLEDRLSAVESLLEGVSETMIFVDEVGEAPPWDELVDALTRGPEPAPAPEPEPLDATRTTDGARIVLIADLADLDDAVKDARRWPVLALDVETAHQVAPRYDEHGKIKRERLDFNRLALRSIQFGNAEVVYVVDCALLPDWKTPGFKRLLETHGCVVAHNSTFEYKVLKRHGVTCGTIRCTMQAERVLFLGLLDRAPSLAKLVLKYLGREMLKDVRDTFIVEREVAPLRPEQIRYAADDVDCLIAIHDAQLRQLEEEQLLNVAEFEWDVQRAFSEVSLRGFRLQTDLWTDLLVKNIDERDAAHARLFETFKPAAIKRWDQLCAEREAQRDAWQAELAGLPEDDTARREALEAQLKKLPSWLKVRPNKETGIREPKKTSLWEFDKVLSSPMQLKGAMQILGLDLKDTNERTLLLEKRAWAEYADDSPLVPRSGLAAIDNLLDFRGLDKRVSTYGQNYLDAISPLTGYIHADYDTLKDTARTGCSDPNVQNVPKRGDGKVYRQCFTANRTYVVELATGDRIWVAEEARDEILARGGRIVDMFDPVFVIADYSQIELRVAAELSGDRNMIAAFRSGMDIHVATAALMFHVDPSEIGPKDYRRTAAKCVNFGILFGIGPGKLAEQITNQPGAPPCSFDNAKKFLRMYAKSYPRLMQWLETMGKSARENLLTTTVMGHRRRFERPEMPSRDLFRADPRAYEELSDKFRARMGGIEREGKNTPVQGTAACIAKVAILELERLLPRYGAGIVGFVHDEIVTLTPDIVADEVAALQKRVMEEAGALFMKKVPCLAEVEIGLNWLGEGLEEAA